MLCVFICVNVLLCPRVRFLFAGIDGQAARIVGLDLCALLMDAAQSGLTCAACTGYKSRRWKVYIFRPITMPPERWQPGLTQLWQIPGVPLG